MEIFEEKRELSDEPRGADRATYVYVIYICQRRGAHRADEGNIETEPLESLYACFNTINGEKAHIYRLNTIGGKTMHQWHITLLGATICLKLMYLPIDSKNHAYMCLTLSEVQTEAKACT